MNYIFKIQNSRLKSDSPQGSSLTWFFNLCLIISLLFTVLQINEIVLQKGKKQFDYFLSGYPQTYSQVTTLGPKKGTMYMNNVMSILESAPFRGLLMVLWQI